MKRINSRLIFFTILMICILVVIFFSSLTIYNNIVQVIVEEKGKAAMNIAVSVAKILEHDLTSLEKLVSDVENSTKTPPADYDTDYYNNIQEIFQDIKKQTDVKYLYSAKKISDTEILYIFDAEDPDSELFSPIGSKDLFGDIEREAYSSRKPDFTEIYDDPIWGELLTGISPVINPKTNEVIAYVGVDVSVNKIKSTLKRIRNFIFINFLFINAVIAFILHRMIYLTTFFSEIDYLTGLYNKSFHENYLRKLTRKYSAGNGIFSLAMIDLDNFKEINDIYGHSFGDVVLKEFSDCLRASTRKTDICSRYGGDEFVVILQDVNEQFAVYIFERLLKMLNSHEFITEHGISVKLTVSIGIAEWNKNTSADQLVEKADKAMYKSKKTGKNKITVYNA